MNQSESVEDYLKAIYQLQEEEEGGSVSTTSLASRLGIANASVTGMLKRLSRSDPKLIEYERYGGVTLSASGQKAALEVIRHHRLIESFLNQKLGYAWDEVHAEAERLEHVISEEMEARIAAALGNPSSDPHGDPIPEKDGTISHLEYPPLSEIPEGQLVILRRILDQEPDLLRYLAELGLTLSTQVRVLSQAPFNGPVNLQIVATQAVVSLGRDLASKILVARVPAAVKERSNETTS